jgi:TetR/AcrR family transcriptional regulator
MQATRRELLPAPPPKKRKRPVAYVRARTTEHKQERRQSIMDATRELFSRRSFADITMADVASHARLAKGTVYGYFRTKEDLFLAVTEEEVAAWLDYLNVNLRAPTSPSLDAVTAIVCRSVVERPLLPPLLAILHSVFEHNIDEEAVFRFKVALIKRGSTTGSRLEALLPFFPVGAGRRFFAMLWAVLIGVHNMTAPAPVVRRVLDRPMMAPLRLDFEATLRSLVSALLAGLREKYESRRSTRSRM